MGFARQEYWSGVPSSYPLQYSLAPLVAHLVKNLPAMQETWVRSWVGKMRWRRERLPTPVFWPGEFHGLYSPWGCKELDTTEQLSLSLLCATLWARAKDTAASKTDVVPMPTELIVCYEMFVTPPNSYVEILTPNVMVLEGGDFGRY